MDSNSALIREKIFVFGELLDDCSSCEIGESAAHWRHSRSGPEPYAGARIIRWLRGSINSTNLQE